MPTNNLTETRIAHDRQSSINNAHAVTGNEDLASPPTEFLVLSDGYPVARTFFDAIRKQVENVLPTMERDASYRLKDLCGDEFWDRLDNGKRRVAGRCMAYMVTKRLLPLSFAEWKHEYPKHYKLHAISDGNPIQRAPSGPLVLPPSHHPDNT